MKNLLNILLIIIFVGMVIYYAKTNPNNEIVSIVKDKTSSVVSYVKDTTNTVVSKISTEVSGNKPQNTNQQIMNQTNSQNTNQVSSQNTIQQNSQQVSQQVIVQQEHPWDNFVGCEDIDSLTVFTRQTMLAGQPFQFQPKIILY